MLTILLIYVYFFIHLVFPHETGSLGGTYQRIFILKFSCVKAMNHDLLLAEGGAFSFYCI